MKIRYFLVLLSLGWALNASATNSHQSNNGGHAHDGNKGSVWSIPNSPYNAHDIVLGNYSVDIGKFFGNKDDDIFSWLKPKSGGFDLGWLFGNLKDILKHFKIDHDWNWGKEPWCPPGPVSAVPEPETYAMMLAGLGLMGFIARRRKKIGQQ